MEKILIAGGLGFIGTNLIKNLVSNGYSDITVVDNKSNHTVYIA